MKMEYQLPHKKKSKKATIIQKISIFLVFEIAFSAVFFPLLLFYGPFQNVKETIVNMSYSSQHYQFINKLFLSTEAIGRITGNLIDNNPNLPINGTNIPQISVPKYKNSKIEIKNINGSFVGKAMIIHDPTRIEAGYSKFMPVKGETVSSIAKRTGSIAAINAGGFRDTNWTGAGGIPIGPLMHNFKFLSGKPNDKSDKWKLQTTIGFTESGILVVGKYNNKDYEKLKIKEAVCFGPLLIQDGKPVDLPSTGGPSSRTAVGQRKDGAIIFLVFDGRTLTSLGPTLKDLQNIFMQLGAFTAVNLDGGKSATMYFNKKTIMIASASSLGERSVASALLVKP
jgi:exopolysaccharide biosynthesis protein